MASEEISFENVDDGERTDGRRMPAYTIRSPMSLPLRWATKDQKEKSPFHIYMNFLQTIAVVFFFFFCFFSINYFASRNVII